MDSDSDRTWLHHSVKDNMYKVLKTQKRTYHILVALPWKKRRLFIKQSQLSKSVSRIIRICTAVSKNADKTTMQLQKIQQHSSSLGKVSNNVYTQLDCPLLAYSKWLPTVKMRTSQRLHNTHTYEITIPWQNDSKKTSTIWASGS